MITKPTVLILGAGASKPYGFPTGNELVNKISCRFENGQTMKHVYDYFSYRLDDYVDEFIDALSHCGGQSIDVFLMKRTEYMEVGKVAIAAAIIPCESQTNLFIDKWYQLLFKNLGTDFEEFGSNKLSIITYNYDRSLEYFLKTSLMNLHGKSEKECIEQLKKISIIHMHGNIGDLPRMGGEYTREYEKKLSRKAFSICEETIKLIHEDKERQETFEQAREKIKGAETVCFLGFGYDETNLDLLNLEYSDLAGKGIYGTAYELGDAKREWFRGYYNNKVNITFGEEKDTIEKFLHNHPIIVRPN
jgi:hypothetical protein